MIVPPVEPDIEGSGVPSDHAVVLIEPNSNPVSSTRRSYKTVVFRPLPDLKLRDFGKWITEENWNFINDLNEPDQMNEAFNEMMSAKLNEYLPQKTLRL